VTLLWHPVQGHFNHAPPSSVVNSAHSIDLEEALVARSILINGVDISSVIGHSVTVAQNYTKVDPHCAHWQIASQHPHQILVKFIQINQWLDEVGTISRAICTEQGVGVVIEFDSNFSYRAATSSPNLPACVDEGEREFEVRFVPNLQKRCHFSDSLCLQVVYPSPYSVDSLLRSRAESGPLLNRPKQLIIQVSEFMFMSWGCLFECSFVSILIGGFFSFLFLLSFWQLAVCKEVMMAEEMLMKSDVLALQAQMQNAIEEHSKVKLQAHLKASAKQVGFNGVMMVQNISCHQVNNPLFTWNQAHQKEEQDIRTRFQAKIQQVCDDFDAGQRKHQQALSHIAQQLTGQSTQRLLELIFEEFQEPAMASDVSEEFVEAFRCCMVGIPVPGLLCVGTSKVGQNVQISRWCHTQLTFLRFWFRLCSSWIVRMALWLALFLLARLNRLSKPICLAASFPIRYIFSLTKEMWSSKILALELPVKVRCDWFAMAGTSLLVIVMPR
jgi:hypothetical protein